MRDREIEVISKREMKEKVDSKQLRLLLCRRPIKIPTDTDPARQQAYPVPGRGLCAVTSTALPQPLIMDLHF